MAGHHRYKKQKYGVSLFPFNRTCSGCWISLDSSANGIQRKMELFYLLLSSLSTLLHHFAECNFFSNQITHPCQFVSDQQGSYSPYCRPGVCNLPTKTGELSLPTTIHRLVYVGIYRLDYTFPFSSNRSG